MQKEYETERLIMKAADKKAAGEILSYYRRNASFLSEWEPARCPEFYTISVQEAQIDKDLAAFESKSDIRFWLYKKELPSRTIGSVAFTNIVRASFQSCYLSYKCDRNEINKGYITEASPFGIGLMFGELALHRIEANIMPRNVRSLKVAEKLGFYNEGLAVKYLKINGVWENHIHMVLRNKLLE